MSQCILQSNAKSIDVGRQNQILQSPNFSIREEERAEEERAEEERAEEEEAEEEEADEEVEEQN